MNVNFKPLGIAAAVAAASLGYTSAVNAQATVAAETELGDLALVPYYTVQDGFSTGVNIVNTSNRTQVLKFRFRRAADSMDALDFNVVLSPEDMYTGFLGLEADGSITWTSNDNSCTAPDYNTGSNKFTMPGIFREGAETGYVEIISMGSPIDETQPIAEAALHGSDGVPANCRDVRDNFFANVDATGADLTDRGVIDSETTHQFTTQATGPAVLEPSLYEASPDSLKVSYFIKSDETGIEFGDNAVHVADFMTGPAMTNQQTGVFSGDLQGFDHPDLNGGAPLDAITGAAGTPRGAFNDLRIILGATTLVNDWSKNSTTDFSVDTDWVVTFPGQYVMLALDAYLRNGADECLRVTEAASLDVTDPLPTGPRVPCDYRDIPVTASFTVYDREEQGIVVQEGDLVVSPQPPVTIDPKALDQEVNVVQWGDNSVLKAPKNVSVDQPAGARFGWASLSTVPADANLALCDIDFTLTPAAYTCPTPAAGTTPVVGFAAWQRAFEANPGSNYGRIVEHSRTQP